MGAEVIQLIERRRSWPTELKLKILLEALQPGATIAATADRHGVARGLVYTWMRAAREGRLPGLSLNDRPREHEAQAFVPVEVEDERPRPDGQITQAAAVPPCVSRQPPHLHTPAPPRPQLPAPPRRRAGLVEVMLGNGRIVKVDESIDASQLARLVAALDGPREGHTS